MRLIVGLGNPGKKYEKTRHNVGMMALEGIKGQVSGFSNWKLEKRLESEVCHGHIASCCEDVILAKPQTFMNLSGRAVKALTTAYRLQTTDLLVVHDDIDLPLGTLRLSHSSGSAGHKGVQSIISTLHTKDFWRLRVGIGVRQGPPPRGGAPPLGGGDPTKFVLKRFPRTAQSTVKRMLEAAVAAVQLIFQKGPHAAQTEINKYGIV